MALVGRTTGSGLVLAEESQDEAQVSRALRRIDDRLCLQKHPSDVAGGWVYKVLRAWSDEHPAEIICTWADEYGRPLPLTSGLVDMVNRLRRDAPGKGPSVDEQNEAHLARVRALAASQADSVIEDHRAKVERGRVAVSLDGATRRPGWAKKNRGLISR